MTLLYKFNEKRATQAAAILIRLEGGSANYTKLLKLLYLADRESLFRTGRTITGSTFVNMPNGPLLSNVYDCIQDREKYVVWNLHIHRYGYDIKLAHDPGDGDLSKFQVDTLTKLSTEHRGRDYREVISLVRQLPEWVSPGRGSTTLFPEVVLERNGFSQEEIAGLRELLQSHPG